MKNEDVKVGMKVVPHSKTVPGWGSLAESQELIRAKKHAQPYLYVTGYDHSDMAWALGEFEDALNGDYFNASDFEPYQEPTATTYVVAGNLPTRVTCWHDTYVSAEAEAKRLCRQEGKTFRVLKVVAVIEPAQPTVHKITG